MKRFVEIKTKEKRKELYFTSTDLVLRESVPYYFISSQKLKRDITILILDHCCGREGTEYDPRLCQFSGYGFSGVFLDCKVNIR